MKYQYKKHSFIYEEFTDDVTIIKNGQVMHVDGRALVRFVIDCHVKPIAKGLLKEVYEDFISKHGHFINDYV